MVQRERKEKKIDKLFVARTSCLKKMLRDTLTPSWKMLEVMYPKKQTLHQGTQRVLLFHRIDINHGATTIWVNQYRHRYF